MNELEKKAIKQALELVSEVNEYSFSSDIIEILEKYVDEKRTPALQMDLQNLFIKHTNPVKEAHRWLNILSNSK